MNRAAWALLALGLVQMTGEALTWLGAIGTGRAIQAVGAASTASPAPKMFASVRGLESFSTKFTLEWDDREGSRQALVLTPEIYAQLRGPDNRRNVYGALVPYGPLLVTAAATRPMFDAASRFATTGDAPLLRELGIDPATVAGPMRVRYEPRPETPLADWPRVIEIERH